MQEDSLKKRYRAKLFSNFIIGVIGAAFVAIVPKALGPIVFGQFVFLQQFFTKVIVFLDMGTSMAFFVKISANPIRKELIVFYFFYALIVLSAILAFIYTLNQLGYTEKIFPPGLESYIYMGLFFGFFTWVTKIFIKMSDAFALTASVENINAAIETAFLKNVISNLDEGLNTNIGEKGHRLSGGERQRIALARALLGGPSIVILDEATSSLDAESENTIRERIDAISHNYTIIVVTHKLSTVRNADYIYVLEEGEIVEHGNYTDLLKNTSRFQELHDLQNT